MNLGVFWTDPGGASGVAWGVFNPAHPDGVAGAIRDRDLAGSTTVSGHVREQIPEISKLWMSFYRVTVLRACIPAERVWFGMEDFIQMPGTNPSGKHDQLSSSIIWGVEGYRMGRADEWAEHKRGGKLIHLPPVVLQPAAMGLSTKDYELKESDAWIVGREHERSAWRHIFHFLKHYRMQYPSG